MPTRVPSCNAVIAKQSNRLLHDQNDLKIIDENFFQDFLKFFLKMNNNKQNYEESLQKYNESVRRFNSHRETQRRNFEQANRDIQNAVRRYETQFRQNSTVRDYDSFIYNNPAAQKFDRLQDININIFNDEKRNIERRYHVRIHTSAIYRDTNRIHITSIEKSEDFKERDLSDAVKLCENKMNSCKIKMLQLTID